MKKSTNMDCNQVKAQWDIYYDSEGDAETHFNIGQHLENCVHCRMWFEGQERVERSLTHAINQPDAKNQSAVDWDQVLNGAGVRVYESTANVGRGTFRVLTALTASILIFFAAWSLLSGSSEKIPSLIKESIAIHRFVASGSLRPDFESTSDIEVDRYLVRRASFPVRCPPRKDSGFEVNGAGMYELEGQSVVYVVGAIDSQPISVFVLPKNHVELIPHDKRPMTERQVHFKATPEWGVAYAVVDKNLVLVVGKSTQEKLEKVVSSYGTYPHES